MQTATHSATKTCSACAHWHAEESEATVGQCRRRAPQTVVLKVDADSQLTSVFPTTSATDWCGDFEAG